MQFCLSPLEAYFTSKTLLLLEFVQLFFFLIFIFCLTFSCLKLYHISVHVFVFNSLLFVIVYKLNKKNFQNESLLIY